VNDLVFRIMFAGLGFASGLVAVLTMIILPWAFAFNKDELHHLYYGWLMVVIAPIHLTRWPEWVVWTVYVLGYWLIVDDWVQHYRQKKDPFYKSFLHRIFARLWITF